MSLLREYIKELLTEDAKAPEDLLVYNDVHVFIRNEGDMAKIFFSYKDGKAAPEPNGSMWIRVAKREPKCGDAWIVAAASAPHGWGPLLYDVAMEWATLNGGGLISDRHTVSQDARGVWDYYMNNRPDVTAHQLDNERDTLTPEKEDNCEQDIAGDMGTYSWTDSDEKIDDDSWVSSALSKRYTAPPKTIRKLRSLGRLIT